MSDFAFRGGERAKRALTDAGYVEGRGGFKHPDKPGRRVVVAGDEIRHYTGGKTPTNYHVALNEDKAKGLVSRLDKDKDLTPDGRLK